MPEGPYYQVLNTVAYDGEKLYECRDAHEARLRAESLNLAYWKGNAQGYCDGRIDGYVVALSEYSKALGAGVREKGVK